MAEDGDRDYRITINIYVPGSKSFVRAAENARIGLQTAIDALVRFLRHPPSWAIWTSVVIISVVIQLIRLAVLQESAPRGQLADDLVVGGVDAGADTLQVLGHVGGHGPHHNKKTLPWEGA